MRVIHIPYYNQHNTTTKKSIEKAIKYLSDKYLIDGELMEKQEKIDLLECITDLTNIYLYMKNE